MDSCVRDVLRVNQSRDFIVHLRAQFGAKTGGKMGEPLRDKTPLPLFEETAAEKHKTQNRKLQNSNQINKQHNSHHCLRRVRQLQRLSITNVTIQP